MVRPAGGCPCLACCPAVAGSPPPHATPAAGLPQRTPRLPSAAATHAAAWLLANLGFGIGDFGSCLGGDFCFEMGSVAAQVECGPSEKGEGVENLDPTQQKWTETES
uniref:Uncharacterized protein n=1 Tax=Oryza barthii TaxID=65489 RepID=A0A0D3FTQ2_9ORYZ